MKKSEDGFSIVEGLIVLIVVGLVGLGGWYIWHAKQNSGQKNDTTTTQATRQVGRSTNENSDKTFEVKDIGGVSVRHDTSWTPEKPVEGFSPSALIKTVDGRSYKIAFQKNDTEYLAKGGAYANELKLFKEITVGGKQHYIATSEASDEQHAYLSSCPIVTDEACSPKLTQGFLFVSLYQEVANAQYPAGLDFSREDDQKILGEFADILTTLKY